MSIPFGTYGQEFFVTGGAMHDGAVVGGLANPGLGFEKTKVEMTGNAPFTVVFGPHGPVTGKPVVGTLGQIRDFIFSEVFPALECFLDL